MLSKITWRKLWLIALIFSIIWLISDNLMLKIEQKKIYYALGKNVSFKGAPAVFHKERLAKIAKKQDIIPGLPEEKSKCARFVRAFVNTLLGEDYFRHYWLHAKIIARIQGKKKLAADHYGIYGDAWQMPGHIIKAGGKTVYNAIDPMNQGHISKTYLNQWGQIGDIIGFYYPASSYNEIAEAEKVYFTHLGIVVAFQKNKNGKREAIIAHMMDASDYNISAAMVRFETLTNIDKSLIFQGQKSKNIKYNYRQGQPLIYLKTILRPAYHKK